ncbi:MAG: CBS domain-containing protein [Phycisphaerales bacterium]
MHTVSQLLQEKGARVHTIDPDTTVLDAARLMNTERIGSLVVVNKGKVVGIFTERDLMRRVVAQEKNPGDTKVGQAMTTGVIAAGPHTSLDEVRAIMREKRIRHMPVIDDNEKLVGMLSIGDLNFAHEKTQEETILYLEQYMYRP